MSLFSFLLFSFGVTVFFRTFLFFYPLVAREARDVGRISHSLSLYLDVAPSLKNDRRATCFVKLVFVKCSCDYL